MLVYQQKSTNVLVLRNLMHFTDSSGCSVLIYSVVVKDSRRFEDKDKD